MSSKRVAIVADVVAALGAGGKPAELAVYRSRSSLIPPGISANVWPQRETVSVSDHDVSVERRLVIRIEVRATGEPADEVLDEYLTWITQALFAAPPSGVREMAELQTDWAIEPERLLEDHIGADALYEIVYHTSESDPET